MTPALTEHLRSMDKSGKFVPLPTHLETELQAEIEAVSRRTRDIRTDSDHQTLGDPMATEKTTNEKLDAFFENFDKRMDAAEAEREKDREDRKTHRELMDSMSKRMDAYDKARQDAVAKEEAAESARHDSATRQRFIDTQAKAEKVYQAFGDSAGAPRWMPGEGVPDYQRRLLTRFQRFSPDWKDKDLAKVDATVLDIAEARIYADSMQEALHPTDLPPNTLRKIETRDPITDRKTISFVGAEDAFWNQYKCFPNDIRAGKFITRQQV